MQDLLTYIKGLRSSPKNPETRITATQKLALFLLVAEGEGAELELNPEQLAAELSLANSKSVYRLLNGLRDESLLRITSRKNALGHPLPALVFPLPEIVRKPSYIQVTRDNPSNIDVTRDEPSYIQETEKAAPSNIQVTKQEPSNIQVTRVISSKNGGESANGGGGERGIAFALKTPPPHSIKFNKEKRGEVFKDKEAENPSNIQVTRHPAVIVWFEVMEEELTDKAAALIIRGVEDLDIWRETLEGWAANPSWSNQNIDGQLSRYRKKKERGEHSQKTPVVMQTKKEKSKEEIAEEEINRKIMYGESD